MKELESPEAETAAALAAANPRYHAVDELVRARRWGQAKRVLDSLAATEDARRLDLALATQALSGALAALAGNAKQRETHCAAVLDAWKDPHQSYKRIEDESASEPESERQRRLGLALSAVGQATYVRAEAERERAVAIVFPKFRGPRTMKPLLAFVKTEGRSWVMKKTAALQRTEAAYRSVVQIQPVPPPRWVMDAAERVGSMWMDFVDDCRRVPRPKEFDDQPKLVEQYQNAIGDASTTFRLRALDAFRTCTEYSDKYRIEDAHSRICRQRLQTAEAQ